MKIILFGASGQVGGAVTDRLLETSLCSSLTLIVRREVLRFADHPNVTQVILDPSADGFKEEVARHAKGHDVGICCIGIGSGTLKMSESQIAAIEVDLVDRFARGCREAGIDAFEVLTAVGSSSAQSESWFTYSRILGRKHKAVEDAGFEKLAVFQPGMIVGNRHTPHWITHFTRFIPDSLGWGNIHLEELAGAFVAHLATRLPTQTERVVCYGNREMKELIRA